MINYSAGGGGYSQTFVDALVAARDAGVLCVASAGNDAVDTDDAPHYPSSYNIESVISVASTDRNDALSSFSNWGVASVDLGAPGSSILSTMPPFTAAFFEDFEMVTMPDLGDQFTLEGPANYWGTVEGTYGGIVARGDAEHSYPYRSNADGWIVTPPFDTTDLRGPSLSFDGRYEVEDGDDALIAEIWDGASWQEFARLSSSDWGDYYLSLRLDLETYRDPATRVRFGWQTDADGNDYYGAEIDNVLARYIGSDYTGETAYAIKNGTSMAAPHVAGTAALLLADRPDMCLTELRNRLILTGDPVPALDGITGSGTRLNAYKALTIPSDFAVLTPNGGEHWTMGMTHTIVWSVFECDPPDTVDIHLLKGQDVYSQLADNAPNTGMFVWSIPEDLPKGTDYRIRVDNGTDVDEGDADFTIWTPLWHVDDDAPEGGNGLTWNSAFKYLQDALAVATDGITIHVAGGTYKPDLDEKGGVVPGDRAATFQLIGGVRLYGGFAGLANPSDPDLRDIEQYETILSGDLNGDDGPHYVDEFAACFFGSGVQPPPECEAFDGNADGDVDAGDLSSFLNGNHYGDNSYHVVTAPVTGTAPELDGFAVVAGCANDQASWDTTIGGGMYNRDDSIAIVRNCTFRGNAAYGSGGGMYNGHYSTPSVTNCVFSGNSAVDRGAGLLNARWSAPTLSGCTFSGNAARKGAGMTTYSDDMILSACTFSGNAAGTGGAMYIQNGAPSLSNCAFHGNTATGSYDSYGGGLYITESGPVIANCTFSGNTADLTGGGLYNTESANPTVTNCIFWGDSPNEFYNLPGSNPVVTFSDVQGGTGQAWFGLGCIDADPLFVDADGTDNIPGNEDDNLRLSANSPCIEAGDNTAVTAISDLDGNPRIMDGNGDGARTIDLGAYEYFLECNDNGVPDVCDIDCAALGGACNISGCGASEDCNASAIPDECEAGGLDDCNANGATDWCELESGVSGDCDANAIPDDCDIAAGTFEDLDLNGIPDVCECAAVSEAPVPESVVYAKNRYLSFEPRNAGEQTAIRVKPLALPPGFEALEGNSLWVGVPRDISEVSGSSDATPPTFTAAAITCEPFYMDWGSVGLLHVYGETVVPGGIFEIRAIHETCFTGADANYSEALVVPSSGVWGDIVGDCVAVPCTPPDGQCNFDDISAVVDKFKNFPDAPIKARADLAPMTPDGIVDFVDIPVAVDAFRGLPYPFYGPSGCP